jgi:hypothetical protein
MKKLPKSYKVWDTWIEGAINMKVEFEDVLWTR